MKTISENWYIFLEKIIKTGYPHTKDDGDKLLESMVNHCMISSPLKKYEPMQISSNMFLDLIEKGEFDIEGYPMKGREIAAYVRQFDDPKYIYLTEDENGDKPFIYTYPERLQNIQLCTREGHNDFYNQYEIIKRRLTEHDGSNRAVATLYSAGLDETEQHIPCLQFLQATIRDNKLLLHVIFRSNDCYSAWPSNMFFISYIGIKLVEDLRSIYPSLKFYGINYNSTSLHIYDGDLDQAKKVIGE